MLENPSISLFSLNVRLMLNADMNTQPNLSKGETSVEKQMNQMTARARLLAIQLVANIDNLKELVRKKNYEACPEHIREIKTMIQEMGQHLKGLRDHIEPENPKTNKGS